MIPNKTDTIEVNSSGLDNTGKFTVNEDSISKLIGVLTNLYADPEDAVIREYSINGLDSQLEAQALSDDYVWRPIEVTTPSAFAMEFKVRDYGVGMTEFDISDIFSQYLLSTKEQSNIGAGMLGLGSKCALSYTAQFTITGFKDGIRTSAIISKDEDGIPVYIIADTGLTTEPNGVEISVPVRERNSFNQKANDFFKWWEPGTVLVNGQYAETHGLSEVKPGIFIFDTSQYYYTGYYTESYIIMGSIPYKLDSSYLPDELQQAGVRIAAYVPMGAVDFPPSREELLYNRRTLSAIEDVCDGLFDEIVKKKQDHILSAPNHREAFGRWYATDSGWRKAIGSITYDGLEFYDQIKVQHWSLSDSGDRNQSSRLHLNNAIKAPLIVTGASSRPTPTVHKKVFQYADSHSLPRGRIIFVDDDIDDPWLQFVPRATIDDIRSIKLPRAKSAPRAEPGYDWYTSDEIGFHRINALSTDTSGKTIVYTSPRNLARSRWKNAVYPRDVLEQVGIESYVLVVLPTNRLAKFLRSHKAISLEEALKYKMDEATRRITNEEIAFSKIDYLERGFLIKALGHDIRDPEIASAVKFVNGGKVNESKKEADRIMLFARRCGYELFRDDKIETVQPVDIFKNYPLVCEVSGATKHVVDYINMVWDRNNS